MTLSCDTNGSMLVKGKSGNPSGKNVYICGDHFVTGTFTPQNRRIFLEWKFLSFDEISCKLNYFRMLTDKSKEREGS